LRVGRPLGQLVNFALQKTTSLDRVAEASTVHYGSSYGIRFTLSGVLRRTNLKIRHSAGYRGTLLLYDLSQFMGQQAQATCGFRFIMSGPEYSVIAHGIG
jgi:hypothetical protein